MIKSHTLTTNTAGLKVGMSIKICRSLISKSHLKKYYNYWFADRYEINNTPACAAVNYKDTATWFL